MNIFDYQGQEEDFYTHILMSILDYKDQLILPEFIKGLIPIESKGFNYASLTIQTRKKACPHQATKDYEYVIGIAPYKSNINKNELMNNENSIPDAWVCGENFNLLFEFKIRGKLDEMQLSAHQKLLNNKDASIIRLNWSDVKKSLENINTKDTVLDFLIKNFISSIENFKSKRNSSGMPKQIISHKNKANELHFVITGNRNLKTYYVTRVYGLDKEVISSDLTGITVARKFIAQYVVDNRYRLPFDYDGDQTVISDFCVDPARSEKKNEWNQWRLGSFII